MKHKRIELCHIGLKENRGIKKFAVAFLKEVKEGEEVIYHTVQIDRARRKRNSMIHWALGEKGFKRPTTQKRFVKDMGKKMNSLKADAVVLLYEEEENVK